MRRGTVAGVAVLGYLIGTLSTDLVAEPASAGTIEPGRAGSESPPGSLVAA